MPCSPNSRGSAQRSSICGVQAPGRPDVRPSPRGSTRTSFSSTGTDTASLRKGPGIYDDVPFPGASGTTAIAGHRTTYRAPFRHIDKLQRGDVIVVEMPYGRFTYAVQETRIVPPNRLSVLRRVTYDRLVLSARHPLYSAAKRIVVFARLVARSARGP